MALITSYSTLQDAISDFLHRSDLSTVDVDLIDLAEKRIQREVRTPDMEAAYSGTIAAGVIAVPSDFLEWRVVYINNDGAKTLIPIELEALLRKFPVRTADGLPQYIARNASNFEFGPYPDSAYAVKGTYYKRLTSVASSWNALATANPDLYLYGSLSAASAYISDDPRIPVWEAAYQMTRDAINAEGKTQTNSGAPLRVVRG